MAPGRAGNLLKLLSVEVVYSDMRPSSFLLAALSLLLASHQPNVATGAPERHKSGEATARFSVGDTSALVPIAGHVPDSLAEGRFYARLPGARNELDTLQVASFAVRATTSPGSIRTLIDVEIHSDHQRQTEAVMRLPIPPGAAITKSVLYVGSKPMTGAFVRRERARAIYDSIVSRRRDPLLAVWNGPSWVDVKIFPVPGKGSRRFQLEWVEPLGGSVDTLDYRIPIIANRGQVVGKPRSLTIDNRRYRTGAAHVRLAHRGAEVVASRPPGEPFGYALVRPKGAVSARANAVLVADTSASMSEAQRRKQRQALERLLADFPEDARISLLAGDWLVANLGRAQRTSTIRAQLNALDDIPSAGALDLEQSLSAAIDEAVAIGAQTIVYVGHGQSRFARMLPDALVERLLDSGISFHLLASGAAVPALRDLAWLSGGRISSKNRLSLRHLLRPTLSAQTLASIPGASGVARKVETWYPLTTVTGELVWLGRFVGSMPRGVLRANDADLQSLWVRANLAADHSKHQGVAYRVLTPYTSTLVLETEADYRRFGLQPPDSDAPAAPVQQIAGDTEVGNATPSPSPVVEAGLNAERTEGLSGLTGDAVGETTGGFGLGRGSAGRGGGGTGWGTIGTGRYGTIGHGSGTGSGYGVSGIGRRKSRVPRIRMGKATVRGSLDKNIIRRIIRRHLPRIRYCYERQLMVQPTLSGRVLTRFTISSLGRVTSAKVNGLGNERVQKCLERALRSMRFPQPRGGGTIMVSYPFVFQPDRNKPAKVTPPPPSKWETALKLLAQGKSIPQLARSAAFAGAPRTRSAAVLGWWLVKSHLRASWVPGEAYLLAAKLLRKGGETRHARRILSESSGSYMSDAKVLYKRWGAAADGKRLIRLATGG